MNVTQKIKIDLLHRQNLAAVDVMQGDAYARLIDISLYFGGEKWKIPEDSSVVIGYFGESGRGAYDSFPDGSPIYQVEENNILIALTPQVTAVAGITYLTVVFMGDNGEQLATFGVPIRVAPNPSLGAGKPQDHYNLKDWVGAGPFYFNVTSTGGAYTADKSYDEIRAEYDAGKETICTLKLVGGETMELPIVKGESDKCIFSAVCGGIAKQVTITRGEDGAAVVAVEDLPPVLLVTVTRYSIDSNIFYEVDTTFAAIRQAYDNNRVVVCKQGSIAMPIAAISGSTAIFSSIRTTNTGERMVHECKIAKGNQADTITYTENKLAYKDDLRPPLYVTVTGSGSGTANTSVADIKTAHEQGRAVYCVNSNYILTLVSVDDSKAVFQANDGVSYRWVQIKSDGNVMIVTGTTASSGDVSALNNKMTELEEKLLPPLYVNADDETERITAADMKDAFLAGRVVLCRSANRVLMLDTYSKSSPIVYFSCVYKGKEYRARIEDVNGVRVVTPETIDLITQDELQAALNPSTDEKYFDIDFDGLVSLKPEYRGSPENDDYPYAISDNDVGDSGSKNASLPEVIVIPGNIGGEEVRGFQKGIFCGNQRVKEVVLPVGVTSIPNGFAHKAIYMEKLTNAEQVKSIGENALSFTRITEANFPGLTTLGDGAFENASCLVEVDLGQITGIGNYVFDWCENLSTVHADKVTSVGEGAFRYSRRLKNLTFLKNVVSIGAKAFWSSRCDFEQAYDTMVASGCTFGENACYKQFNSTDYWTGVAHTPCKNPLGSLFHQKNPLWADKQIGDFTSTDGSGKPSTYRSTGCALIVLSEIYSAFEGVTLTSPEKFFAILKEKGLDKLDFRYRETWCEIANGLGYETEYIPAMTAEALQKIYDALADGALLYKSTMGKSNVDGGHAMLGYGINTDGEMLTADSSMHCDEVGIYESHKTAWHIYKHGSAECDCVIVKKPGA